ncbi:MAG: hypothetical protein AAGI08_03140 [Bacteroidota bacterium]
MNFSSSISLRTLALALLVSVVAGCDSSDSDGDSSMSDADRLVGTWTTASVTASGLGGANILPIAGLSLGAEFNSDGTYTLTLRNNDGDMVAEPAGTYTIDEDTQSLTFAGEDLDPVTVSYTFNGDDEVAASTTGDQIAGLGFDFGDLIDPATLGNVTLTIQRT